MKRIMQLIVFLAMVIVLEAGYVQFSFIVTKEYHDANTKKLEDMLLELWGKPDTKEYREWVNNGWVIMTNEVTGVTNMLYDVTMSQTRGRATKARIEKWEVELGLSTNRFNKSKDTYGDMEKKGWAREESKTNTAELIH